MLLDRARNLLGTLKRTGFMPHERYVFRSRMSADEIESLLGMSLKPSRWLPAGTGEFSGKASAGTFMMIRDIRGRNSFLPIGFGKLLSDECGGTVVTLTLRMHALVIAMLGAFLTVMAFAVIANGVAVSSFLIALVTLAFVVFGVIPGFKEEAPEYVRFLNELLQDDVAPFAASKY